MRYLFAEVTRGYLLEENEQLYTEKQRRFHTFMKTPRELEKLMVFGLFICLDTFLFVFTLLPVRACLAALTCIYRLITCSGQSLLEQSQKCDIIRAAILVLGSTGLGYMDTSALYHIIRGQSVIKLYVMYNMLEIFDRLLASIGQDTLDSLYWVTCDKSKSYFTAAFYFFIANIYVLTHSTVLLVEAVTLNVAINSHNKALLTIMISNNFVELKGSVFKKFEADNLFQMSCSDIRERFHYVVLMSVVSMRNLEQFNWDPNHLETLIPQIALVLCGEVVVDWIKHAFITKFNDITPDIYQKYKAILSKDLAISRHRNVHSEHSDLVSRRMGFTPLPLGCLVWQTVNQSLTFPGMSGKVFLAICFLCLVTAKVLVGICLLGHACKCRQTTAESPRWSSNSTHSQGPVVKHKKGTSGKALSDVDRYTLCSNRIE